VREKVQKVGEGNRDIAAQNLELEPKLEEKRALLLERCNELNRLREDYDKKYSDLSTCSSIRNSCHCSLIMRSAEIDFSHGNKRDQISQ